MEGRLVSSSELFEGVLMKVRRITLSVSLAAGVLAAVSSLGVGTALADIACNDTEVCFYPNANYGGSVALILTGSGGWINAGDVGFPNNEMSSWKNRSNDDARWATGSGGGGDWFCVDANTNEPSLAPARDDTATSFRRYQTNDVCGA